jgi:hypothetical protein
MNVYKGTDDGSQLELKYVAVNTMIKAAVVCDGCDAYTCDLAATGMYVPKT